MDLTKLANVKKSVSHLSKNDSEQQLNPLLVNMKQKSQLGQYQKALKGGDNKFLQAVFGNQKVKTDKEVKID
jgi:hypothetical protein